MLLKVSSATKPKKLAGAILHIMRENGGTTELQAIGAGAVNQAIKAVAIARKIVAQEETGTNLKVIPGFVDLEDEGRRFTAIKLNIVQE